jgi:two-component system, NtrC family, sensor kinase
MLGKRTLTGVHQWGQIALLAIVYYATAALGRDLASTPNQVTPLWPPDGFALAAVLLLGWNIAPGIAIGSFFANFRAFLQTSNSMDIVTSLLGILAIACGTTLGTLLAAYLLEKFVGTENLFNRKINVIKFVFFGAMSEAIVSASIGVSSLCFLRGFSVKNYAHDWVIWWMSNFGGIMIFTPFLLLTYQFFFAKTSQISLSKTINKLIKFPIVLGEIKFQKITSKWIELCLLMGLVIWLCKIAFGGGYFIEYILIPCLVWGVLRFGLWEASLLIVIISSSAVLGTVRGYGPFFITNNLNTSLVLLQSFICVVVLTTLILSASISEQQAAENELRIEREELAIALQELKYAQSQLIQTEKMSSLGQLVAGLAHEINHPVKFISGNLSYAENYVDTLIELIKLYQIYYPQANFEIQDFIEDKEINFLIAEIPKVFSSMAIGAERIKHLILSLHNFAQTDQAHLQFVDIHDGIESTLMILQHRLKSHGDYHQIELIKEYNDLPEIECYVCSINQVFMNILTNAIEVLEPKRILKKPSSNFEKLPRIEIMTNVYDENYITISILDNGSGISPDIISRIFEPFFTTKPIGKGTGLGLSISYQIVVYQHKGQLECFSVKDQGTQFMIKLPVTQKAKF